MKIVIDARFLGPNGTGIGRYTEKLIDHLQIIDQENDYVVLLLKDNFELFKPTNPRWSKVLANARWYTFKEQTEIGKVLGDIKPDLVHFPHFNIPVLYFDKFVVTIHDLIKSDFASTSASTKNSLVYWGKHFVYEYVIRTAARRSKKIIVPANIIKEKVVQQLGVPSEKVQVTYESTDQKFFAWGEEKLSSDKVNLVLKKYSITQPYIIYVGNAYPYKNLNRLIQAMKLLPDNLSLVNPCARSVFYDRLAAYAEAEGMGERVILPGYVPDEDLAILYRAAEAYVFPTLSEGFGIPALEAMASKLPVVCSEIPVLKEVCGDNALYFNPTDVEDIATKIRLILGNKKLREQMAKEGLERAHQFSWHKMAMQTLEVYKEATR